MKWFVLAVCLIQAAHLTIANGVPVFVWGDAASNAAPVLSTQAKQNLDAVLADETAAKVIFVESQLTSDDFNYCSFDGASCFSFLGQQTAKFYSPSIESPLSHLRTRVWSGPVKTVYSNDEFTVAAGETVFVHFRDGVQHPTQNDRLAAHDAAIKRIVTRLEEEDIVYVYTGIEDHAGHRRVARQATTETTAAALEHRDDKYVIRLMSVQTQTDGAEPKTLTITGTPTFTVEENQTKAKLTLNVEGGLEMDIVQEGARWWVDQLTYDSKHFTSGVTIGANHGFSFACTPSVSYASPNQTTTMLILTGLQMQVDLTRTETTKMAFGDADNCVGFTSAGIWGGLFVTILLLAIMTIGISWMLDIRTMDRFDDAKGKTITINAQE